jgi:hypothetical protein
MWLPGATWDSSSSSSSSSNSDSSSLPGSIPRGISGTSRSSDIQSLLSLTDFPRSTPFRLLFSIPPLMPLMLSQEILNIRNRSCPHCCSPAVAHSPWQISSKIGLPLNCPFVLAALLKHAIMFKYPAATACPKCLPAVAFWQLLDCSST